jgi:hypothetical protein
MTQLYLINRVGLYLLFNVSVGVRKKIELSKKENKNKFYVRKRHC